MTAAPRLVGTLLLLLAASGCHAVTFVRRVKAEPKPTVETWHHHAFHGLWDVSGPLDVSKLCPNGVARVETRRGVVETAVQVGAQEAALITLGTRGGGGVPLIGGLVLPFYELWTPTGVRVFCAAEAPLPPAPSLPRLPVVSRKFLLLPVQARQGVDPNTALVLTDALSAALRRYEGLTIATPDDVATALTLEQQKQILGCEEATCIAEVGGAIAADRVVRGTLSRLGNSLVVSLSSIDPRTGIAAHVVTERLQNSTDERLLDLVPRVADALVREPADGLPR